MNVSTGRISRLPHRAVRTVCLFAVLLLWAGLAEATDGGVPMVIGGRTIHVFGAALGDISAAERAEAARRHVERAFDAGGAGWTSITPTDEGILIELDGEPMFTVTAADAALSAGKSIETLANESSRVLQKAWAEAQARRDPSINVAALVRALAALAILALILVVLARLGRQLRRFVTRSLAGHIDRLSGAAVSANLSGIVLRLVARSCALLLWLFGLLAVVVFLSYVLGLFVVTRPFSEALVGSLTELLGSAARAVIAAVPNLVVAVVIFLIARIATQISGAIFVSVAAGRLQLGSLDAHTAPATRQLVNSAIWLFSLAMAYPYLPGAHTEAFKGLSVLLGIMVSIGGAGLVGQIASGLILVFTRALLVGEYVRIQSFEGTVRELGLCMTRLRTAGGEEIALPNSLVLTQVTHNYSRHVDGEGVVIDAEITIGYDTPWRQVHALLLAAASRVEGALERPAPFVVQTALSDFYVGYRLVMQVDGKWQSARPRVVGELHAAIQDEFNRHGVQIMSPHYRGDPATAKWVPESDWYRPPAARPAPPS